MNYCLVDRRYFFCKQLFVENSVDNAPKTKLEMFKKYLRLFFI